MPRLSFSALPFVLLLPALGLAPYQTTTPPQAPATGIRFSVGIDPKLVTTPAANGRVIVVLQKIGDSGESRRRGGEPRHAIGSTGLDAPPILATDMLGFKATQSAVLDENCTIFPI